jgi:protein-tyrosine kinase
MSRIHEALKKAGLEGTSSYGDPADLAPKVSRVFESNTQDVPPLIVAPALETDVSSAEEQFDLSFEELQARCAARWTPNHDGNVFTLSVNPRVAEQFRTLRSRLYQIRTDQQLKTLLVTSAVSGEGKTFVTTNLGYAIARQSERRVLLIDADLRHPQMHGLLGARSSPGLADYLRADVPAEKIIQYSADDNLWFIAAGTQVPNPSELLCNGRMALLVKQIARIFEWVIFDSPPSLPVADATLLAQECDASVVVARARVTPAAVIQKGIQELRGGKVIGVVLNAVEEGALTYGYYHPRDGKDYTNQLSLAADQ